VRKLENGHTKPSIDVIREWVAATSGHPGDADRLVAMRRDVQATHRQFRSQRRRGGHAQVQVDLDRLFRQAKHITYTQIMLIPGLLQTPEYAAFPLREVMELTGDDTDVNAAVAAKMQRQAILYEPGRVIEFLVFEAALVARLVPDEIMLGQLDRLQTVIGLPNVTLRIVPLAAQLPLVPVNAWIALDEEVVYVETFTGEDLLYGAEAATYAKIAEAFRAVAVTGAEARELITAASQMRTAGDNA
jgi:hypothetical protein